MYTKEEILRLFRQSSWTPIKVTVETGHTLEITPCSMAPIVNEKSVEFFIIDGPIPWMCANTVDELVPQLNNFKTTWSEYTTEVESIRKFYNEKIKSGNYSEEDWGWYSDWHKDVFGIRPIRPVSA